METNNETDKKQAGQIVNELVSASHPAIRAAKTIQDLLHLGDILVRSGMFPVKTPEAAVSAILLGRSLGFDEMTSMLNIYVVNGRGTINRDLVATLLLRKNIDFEVIKDYKPVYNYIDNAGLEHDEIDVLTTPEKYQVLTGMAFDKDGNLKPTVKIDDTKIRLFRSNVKIGSSNDFDVETIIRFTRGSKVIHFSYKWSDAIAQGLAGKDNWQKMPKVMVYTRALVMGAKRIAPDAFTGVYEFSEIADADNVPYKVNEDGVAEPKETITVDTAAEITNVTVITPEERKD